MTQPIPVTPATVDAVFRHAEGWPMTVGFYLMVIAFLAVIAWLVLKFYPSWETSQREKNASIVSEAEKTRQHLTDVLDKRGQEASRDVATITSQIGTKVDAMSRDVADVEALTRDLTGKVAEVHGKVSGIHDLVRAMATKTGVIAALLVVTFSACYYVGSARLVAASKSQHASRVVASGAAAATTANQRPATASPVPESTGNQCTVSTDCTPPAYCSDGYCVRNTASLDHADDAAPTRDAPSSAQPASAPPSSAPPAVTNPPATRGSSDLAREYGEDGYVAAPFARSSDAPLYATYRLM